MSKPTLQTLKGFRDFLPEEKRKRDYVAGKIKTVFERFGFAPLETPTLEYADLLLGKYGEEADKLVYSFEDRGERKIALRYDQTVPTARVLVQYQNELPRYFRRYQIQNVFRADKPQKGRFREFTQCDCDIFGSTSPLADAELLACVYQAYKEIGFPTIKIVINDRQTLLSTLNPFVTEKVSVFSIIQTIDKLDKMSESEVINELVQKGLSQDQAESALRSLQQAQPSENLQQIMQAVKTMGVNAEELEFNPAIARGLDYYTGMIFEIQIPGYTVGSVAGGGRYDNLIRDLSGYEMPATGFAIGFDRTVEAADQLDLIPTRSMGTQVLVTVFDEKFTTNSLEIATQLRQAGISTEVYPAIDKLGKQFKLADQKNIFYVVIIGEDEVQQRKVTLKTLQDGQQQLLTIEQVISEIKTIQG